MLFVFIESRAKEPIIPLELFKISVFSTASLYSFILGFAMFGAIVFLPVYYQVVKGFSPTESGLAFLPMVVGIFSTSISCGIVMSRTGRYKIFPILGAVTVMVALFLLAQIGVDTPYWKSAIAIYLFGAGLGFSMQILITIVQNAVDKRHMGTATSSIAFFRSMGGTFGAAIFGAVLSSRLAVHLADGTSAIAGGVPGTIDTNNVHAIAALPEPIKGFVLEAFALSLDDVFLWAIPALVVALVISLFIKEVPLKTREGAVSDPEEIAIARSELHAFGVARSGRSAWSRSERRSSTDSSPTDSRIRSSGTASSESATEACVMVAGSSISDSTPPRDSASVNKVAREQVAKAASLPSLSRIDTMPPNAFIWSGRELVAGMLRQSRVVDVAYGRVRVSHLRDLHRRLAVPFHPDGQRLEPTQYEERVERAWHGTG